MSKEITVNLDELKKYRIYTFVLGGFAGLILSLFIIVGLLYFTSEFNFQTYFYIIGVIELPMFFFIFKVTEFNKNYDIFKQ